MSDLPTTRADAVRWIIKHAHGFTGRLDPEGQLEEINIINACEILLSDGEDIESFCGDHCGWIGKGLGLASIEDIHDRLLPGRDCPSGQCPDCGRLTFKRKDLGYAG